VAITAGIAALALLLGACGKQEQRWRHYGTGRWGQRLVHARGSSAPATDFTACMVYGTGGIDDKSFNASRLGRHAEGAE